MTEKKRTFGAVAELGGDDALEWFVEVLSPKERQWFASRKEMEVKRAAAYGVWSEFDKRDIGGISFEATPSVETLSSLLAALARARSASQGEQDCASAINAALWDEGIRSIEILRPRLDEVQGPRQEVVLDRRQRAVKAYQQVLSFIRESFVNLESPAGLNVRQAVKA